MKFQVYRDKKGEWRWRFIAKNGRIIAVSSEGYKNMSDCTYSIYLLKSPYKVEVLK